MADHVSRVKGKSHGQNLADKLTILRNISFHARKYHPGSKDLATRVALGAAMSTV